MELFFGYDDMPWLEAALEGNVRCVARVVHHRRRRSCIDMECVVVAYQDPLAGLDLEEWASIKPTKVRPESSKS